MHFLLTHAWFFFDHWFWHPLIGRGYQFWSGIGSDFSELALIGAIIGIIRHLNCHAKGCWRRGAHPVEGTPYKVCKHHHPDIPDKGATAEHIEKAYREAQK